MTPYPLQWPQTLPREQRPIDSAFARRSPGQAQAYLKDELRRLGATNVVITTNADTNADGTIRHRQRRIDDTGVAVYFRQDGETRVMALDTYTRLEDNLHGLALTIDALRAIERHGSKQMLSAALVGFAALPAPETWHQVLDVPETASPEEVRRAYNAAMLKAHPDTGGSREAYDRVQKAVDQYNNRPRQTA